jgi:hypothetical protein
MAEILIEHGGDGTTVTGTTREDAPTLKAAGFKWSSRQQFWFLPRTWRETTRRARVQQLAKALGERAEVVYEAAAKSTTAEERAEQIVGRAEELADKHTGRAERAEQESDEFYQRSRDKVAGIPFGQPILVGHYSQRYHEKALDDSWRLMGKSVEAQKIAERAEDRARAAGRRAASYDSPPVVGRRIETRRAELGRWKRSLAGANPEGAWYESAVARVEELEADIARDERVLEASGVLRFNRQTVRPGDRVKIRGDWAPVVKSNPKTVVVHWERSFDLPYIWAEVEDHRKFSANTEAEMS